MEDTARKKDVVDLMSFVKQNRNFQNAKPALQDAKHTLHKQTLTFGLSLSHEVASYA